MELYLYRIDLYQKLPQQRVVHQSAQVTLSKKGYGEKLFDRIVIDIENRSRLLYLLENPQYDFVSTYLEKDLYRVNFFNRVKELIHEEMINCVKELIHGEMFNRVQIEYHLTMIYRVEKYYR